MKIIVDAMGGDHAPLAPVEGALRAAAELGVTVALTGQEEPVRTALAQLGHKDLPAGVELIPASEVITMEDDPATAFKRKRDSSMTVGLELVKAGDGDAFVSAGSTGALLTGATLLVKRIRGIRRAALAPVVPTMGGSMVLVDAGATAECTPEYLLQYAFMGAYYARRFLGVPEPRVALLNIGAEPTKGTDLQRTAHRLLTEADAAGRIRFVGNLEAREALTVGADVLVADGYAGNIFLKTYEGSAKFILGMIKGTFLKSGRGKLAALTMRSDLADLKRMLDPSEVGGSPLLGISKPVIKAHGSADAYAFFNAIRQAMTVAESGLAADIEANIEHMRLSVDRA